METLIRFDFNSKKGIVFLEYLLDAIGKAYNYMSLLKLAFFADRYHIRNYGRPVSGDIYYAMKLGPVPSKLKDIIDVQGFYSENIIKTFPYIVELQHSNIDKTLLSKSDIEAIEFSISNFSKIGEKPFDIANLTHAYPEWEKYRDHFNDNNMNNRFDMDYLDFLKNAAPNHIEFKRLKFTDPFLPLTDSEKQDLIEEITEMSTLYGSDS